MDSLSGMRWMGRAPNEVRLTERPVRPRRVYSMGDLLSVDFMVSGRGMAGAAGPAAKPPKRTFGLLARP